MAWLGSAASRVEPFWPGQKNKTPQSPHTINHYRRLISLSAASEIKNSNRFMRTTAGSPLKANAIAPSCIYVYNSEIYFHIFLTIFWGWSIRGINGLYDKTDDDLVLRFYHKTSIVFFSPDLEKKDFRPRPETMKYFIIYFDLMWPLSVLFYDPKR